MVAFHETVQCLAGMKKVLCNREFKTVVVSDSRHYFATCFSALYDYMPIESGDQILALQWAKPLLLQLDCCWDC